MPPNSKRTPPSGHRCWANPASGFALTQRDGSPLEYACHVRDVFILYDQRLMLMLTDDNPLYPNWDQDAAAIQARYGEQDPAVVSTELVAASAILAARFFGVRGEQWERPGRRSDGARFSIGTFSRYLLHDPVHHLWDVTR